MTTVAFNCDRCSNPIVGTHAHGGTGGFYVVSAGAWSKYGRAGEHLVCDHCVQSMPAYQADYGLPTVTPRG